MGTRYSKKLVFSLLLFILFFVSIPFLFAERPFELEYAKRFSVRSEGELTFLRVRRPWDDSTSESRYLLFPRSSVSGTEKEKIEALHERFSDFAPFLAVATPVEKMVVLSTTYLYPLEQFGELDVLRGIGSKSYVYSKKVRKKIEGNIVAEVGNGPNIDLERIVRIDPQIVMAGGPAGNWNTEKKLTNAGVPVVLNIDYLEKHPLGRAEWIKFISLFFDEEEHAERIFQEVEKKYTRLAERTEDIEEKPSVFFNRPMQGRWVVPESESYMARFLEDAGGSYIFSSESGSGSAVLDIESVYTRASDADYWLHQYGWDKLGDVGNTDPRLTDFEAVRRKQVVNNDARERSWGANDFYESGPYRPDVILSDLISIFHPTVLPEHELHFYRFLK